MQLAIWGAAWIIAAVTGQASLSTVAIVLLCTAWIVLDRRNRGEKAQVQVIAPQSQDESSGSDLETIRREHHDAMRQLQSTNEERINALRSEHVTSLKSAQEHHDANLEKARLEAKRELEKVRDANRKRIERLVATHTEQVEHLTRERTRAETALERHIEQERREQMILAQAIDQAITIAEEVNRRHATGTLNLHLGDQVSEEYQGDTNFLPTGMFQQTGIALTAEQVQQLWEGFVQVTERLAAAYAKLGVEPEGMNVSYSLAMLPAADADDTGWVNDAIELLNESGDPLGEEQSLRQQIDDLKSEIARLQEERKRVQEQYEGQKRENLRISQINENTERSVKRLEKELEELLAKINSVPMVPANGQHGQVQAQETASLAEMESQQLQVLREEVGRLEGEIEGMVMQRLRQEGVIANLTSALNAFRDIFQSSSLPFSQLLYRALHAVAWSVWPVSGGIRTERTNIDAATLLTWLNDDFRDPNMLDQTLGAYVDHQYEVFQDQYLPPELMDRWNGGENDQQWFLLLKIALELSGSALMTQQQYIEARQQAAGATQAATAAGSGMQHENQSRPAVHVEQEEHTEEPQLPAPP